MKKDNSKIIYLDNAATTPVRPEVLRAMSPYWSKAYGNPSALYKLGLEARGGLEKARRDVAETLYARPEEIIFTAGGSESVNLAIIGAARAYRQKHKTGGHIITSKIEHHAVLRTVEALTKQGFTATIIDVDKYGFFSRLQVERAVQSDTFLTTLMYANNEVGTVEPIAEIGKLIEHINRARKTPILFHTDACQAAGYLPLRVDKLHVGMLTLNGSKIYGPKQTGCLYVRKGTTLSPLIYGGGQERNLRSGTENVAGAVGFATALKLAQQERDKETKRLLSLQKYFISEILRRVPNASLNGPNLLGHKDGQDHLVRLPNNIHISFDGIDGEALVLYLDAHNIAAATGSACSTDSTDPSHVLVALGLHKSRLLGSIRFTTGKSTTKEELTHVIKLLPKLAKQLRQMTREL